VRLARAVFDRVSVDLIYALPGQRPAEWARELDEVVALGPEHISAYQLTLEPGTSFARAAQRGRLEPVDPDLAADLFEATQTVLGEAGFGAYEISSHALTPAARSRHNLVYWRGEDYVGVGPGAHGRLTIGGERWERVAPKGIAAYIAEASDRRADKGRLLGPSDAALERLILGLRTHEGVALADLAPLNIRGELESLASAGFVDLDDDRVVARPAGRMVLDRLVLDLAVAHERSAS
jgi:oxygen-independent coproporphyrinogen-3 oxidase